MERICDSCAKNVFLKTMIQSKGQVGICSLCGKSSNSSIDTSDHVFLKTVTSLIRYHLSEWEYHTKLGGVNLDRLLSKENPIFYYHAECSEDSIDNFLMSFIDELYQREDIHLNP